MLVPYQRGRGSFPVYRGGPPYMGFQRGRGFGSVLGSIFRNVVVPTAKTVGKSLLKTGLRKASNVMRGVADGQNIGEAMVQELIPTQQSLQVRQPRQVAVQRRQPQKRKRQQQNVRRRKVARKDIFTNQTRR